MNHERMIVSMAGDAIVITSGREHPEPRPLPGAIARPWNACTIPGCDHEPCPAKLRTWASYGQRYVCTKPGCLHHDCPPRQRAEEDSQPFGLPYDGPALPQHVIGLDGRPLGSPMQAIKDGDGAWRLVARPSPSATPDA